MCLSKICSLGAIFCFLFLAFQERNSFLYLMLQGKYINGTTLTVDGGLWLSKPRHLSKEAVKQLSRAVERRSRKILVGVPKSKL